MKTKNETFQYLMNYKGDNHEKLQKIIMEQISICENDYLITNIEKFTLNSLPENNMYLIETRKKVSDKTLMKNITEYMICYQKNNSKPDYQNILEFDKLEEIIELSSIENVKIL